MLTLDTPRQSFPCLRVQLKVDPNLHIPAYRYSSA